MRNLSPKKIVLSIVAIVILFMLSKKFSFHTIPKEKIQSIKIGVEETFEGDEYRLMIQNPVNCPNRFFLSSQDEEVNELLSGISPVRLKGKADTTIVIKGKGDLSEQIKIKFKWGDPNLPIRATTLEKLPFPEGRRFRLLQGNNSYPTHNHAMSRYAFDFTMKTGDTITSSQNGFVVTSIEGYDGWGYSDEWKSYVNQVIVYDTASNLFTMYGHLKQNGSLVELGQYVTVGEPIAISGKTGQTSEEHLHFNVLQADNGKSGLKSYPLDSIGQYKVEALKRYQWMKH